MISTPPPPAPPPSHPNELYTLRCRFRCSLWWCQITPPATFPTTVRSGISLCFIGVLTGSCQSSFFFSFFFSRPSCSRQRLYFFLEAILLSPKTLYLFLEAILLAPRLCTFFSRPSRSHQRLHFFLEAILLSPRLCSPKGKSLLSLNVSFYFQDSHPLQALPPHT